MYVELQRGVALPRSIIHAVLYELICAWWIYLYNDRSFDCWGLMSLAISLPALIWGGRYTLPVDEAYIH